MHITNGYFYNGITYPFSEKQIRSLQESTARINIWEGSVRSGKSYISVYRFIQELINGPEGDYLILCKTYDTFKRNIKPLFEQILGMDFQYYSGKREIVLWGKRINVVGCDDERSESKIRGLTASGCYVDEISIIPQSVWQMAISRCAMKGARIFGTTNPDSPFHWLKVDYLTNNPDVKSWQFTLKDNPILEERDREYLNRQYKGLWYQRFIEGLWVQAEGSIYDSFDASRHVIPHPPGLAQYHIAGIDYGTTNPCAFVLLGINYSKFPNIWVEEEYYYDSKVHQRQKTDSEYAQDFKNFIKDKAVTHIYIDPSAASFKLELLKQGISNLYDAENEVIDGIRFVSAMMNDGTLKFCANCKELIKEMQSYVWDARCAKTGIDKPMKQFDHLLDSLRYSCFTHLFNKNRGGRKPEDIDRDYREAMGGIDFPGPFTPPNIY